MLTDKAREYLDHKRRERPSESLICSQAHKHCSKCQELKPMSSFLSKTGRENMMCSECIAYCRAYVRPYVKKKPKYDGSDVIERMERAVR